MDLKPKFDHIVDICPGCQETRGIPKGQSLCGQCQWRKDFKEVNTKIEKSYRQAFCLDPIETYGVSREDDGSLHYYLYLENGDRVEYVILEGVYEQVIYNGFKHWILEDEDMVHIDPYDVKNLYNKFRARDSALQFKLARSIRKILNQMEGGDFLPTEKGYEVRHLLNCALKRAEDQGV